MFNKLLARFRAKPAPLPTTESASSAAPRPRPLHVTDEDFDSVVLGSDKLTVVDFWAEWCQPCHVMAASIQFLAEDYDGRVLVAKVDVDENPSTAERYNLMGIPTVIIFRNGEEIDRHTGIANIQQLSAWIERLMNEE
ncbi:MAG: thioredoxin [Caldilineaceae bacterium]